ncbi:MAG TPA: RICIN domain-containing protein [Streptosporangiaceae bacterium]
MAALLFAGGLAAGLGAGLTAVAHASDPMPPAKAMLPAKAWNEVFLPFGSGKGDTMCVEASGGSGAAGAGLRLSHCHAFASDGASQRWRFLDGRFHQVSNANSGLCIGFPGGSLVTAARLVLQGCDEAPGWQLVRQSRDGADPYFRLETSGPGGPALCMAAGNLGDNDQTPLVAASCQGFGNAAEILELG